MGFSALIITFANIKVKRNFTFAKQELERGEQANSNAAVRKCRGNTLTDNMLYIYIIITQSPGSATKMRFMNRLLFNAFPWFSIR